MAYRSGLARPTCHLKFSAINKATGAPGEPTERFAPRSWNAKPPCASRGGRGECFTHLPTLRMHSAALLQFENGPPAPKGDNAPNGLDQAERPGPLQEAVSRSEPTGPSKRKDKPVATPLQGVCHQHGHNSRKAKEGQPVHDFFVIPPTRSRHGPGGTLYRVNISASGLRASAGANALGHYH